MSNKEYKCPCCGGAISFDSSIQKMKCPYCDTEFDVETFAAYDEHLSRDAADNTTWEDVRNEWTDPGVVEYVCNSCGGVIMCDDTTVATSCPYCDNPVVMMGKVSGTLKPDIIIPFKYSKEQAKEAYIKHLKKKKLLPKVFRDENHIDEIKGLYVPFWLFDADTNTHIRCKATKVRSWRAGNYRYTETSHYSVLRGGTQSFRRVPVDGSSAMPDDLMESVEPYMEADEKEFATAYLAGYLADKYDVDAESSRERASTRIKSSAVEALKDTIHGYASVHVESSSINYLNAGCRYAMYPVWILNTTWRDKKFIFAMNGQTGKFVGNLPVDWRKYWLRFAIYSISVAAVLFGIVWLINM